MLMKFKTNLIQKILIKEKSVPFYLKWVADGYAFLDSPRSEPLGRQGKEQFLQHLAKTHEDWQVKQAEHALRLYAYFLSLPDNQTTDLAWTDLENRARHALRLRHRAYSTEKTYLTWLRSFRRFVKSLEPSCLSAQHIQDFLSDLAVEKHVSPSTQNQALNALIFVYRHALGKHIGEHELDAVRATYKRRLPVVLTTKEVHEIFKSLPKHHGLMAKVIYGCGLRLMECLNLRIKDVDFEQTVVIVRAGKGDKDRRTVLPETLKDILIEHVATVRSLYDQDRYDTLPGVSLPHALDRKYPNAGKEWS